MTAQRHNVLVIDDHQGWCEAIASVLDDALCDVEFAKTYNGAIKKIGENSYDLVILDIRLREEAEYDVQGIDILEKIYKDKKDLPVIILTGHATPALKQKTEWYGAFAFVEKASDDASFDRDLFLEKVQEAFDSCK